ncbi:unnamed protein product [Urochloa humidicola]
MASSSSSPVNPLLGHPVTEKLSKTNHALWKAQVRAAVRGARLQGFLTGATKAPPAEIIVKGANDKEEKVPNPALEDWEATDQQVLGYLLSSLSKEVLSQVATCATATEAWTIIEEMFASQTRARTVNTRIALATSQKGSSSVEEYFGKIKKLGDEMAAAGRPLEDEELIEYIITGLGEDFNPLVTSLCTRLEPLKLGEFYSQLLNFESRMDLVYGANQGSSANSASRGRGRGRNNSSSRGRSQSRGGFTSGGRGNSGNRGGNSGGNYARQGGGRDQNYNNQGSSKPLCQVCYKKGHTASECWHRFDEDYVPDQRLVAAATSSYGVDTNWYLDTGATDNVTGELEKLTMKKKYNGADQIHTASGTGSGNEEYSP